MIRDLGQAVAFTARREDGATIVCRTTARDLEEYRASLIEEGWECEEIRRLNPWQRLSAKTRGFLLGLVVGAVAYDILTGIWEVTR